jgi:hypothetical protein
VIRHVEPPYEGLDSEKVEGSGGKPERARRRVGCFEFVSPAYVHGIMDGEVVERELRGRR